MHCRVHVRQYLFTGGQTKRVVTSFCMARIPGWESPCSNRNPVRRNGSGTYGRRISVERLQYIPTSLSGHRIFFNFSALQPDLIISRSSISFSCVAASVLIFRSLRSGIEYRLHYCLSLLCTGYRRKLSDVDKVTELPWRTLVEILIQRVYQGFMIRIDREISSFDGVSESFHRGIHRE